MRAIERAEPGGELAPRRIFRGQDGKKVAKNLGSEAGFEERRKGLESLKEDQLETVEVLGGERDLCFEEEDERTQAVAAVKGGCLRAF